MNKTIEALKLVDQKKQEPVWWHCITNGAQDGFFPYKPDDDMYKKGTLTPLYAAPVSVEAAVLAERENCAKVCEEGVNMWPGEYHEEWNDACEDRAAAIRARGEK